MCFYVGLIFLWSEFNDLTRLNIYGFSGMIRFDKNLDKTC